MMADKDKTVYKPPFNMPGKRYYIPRELLLALEAESRLLGIEVNDLINLKLKRGELERDNAQQELKNLSLKLERCELILLKLCELLQSGLIDMAYVRGAMESQTPDSINEAATSLEARRLEQSLKILEEVLRR